MLAVAVAGCGRNAPAPGDAGAGPTAAPLAVDYAGCEAIVRRGHDVVCELGDSGSLRLALPEKTKLSSVLSGESGGPLATKANGGGASATRAGPVEVTVPGDVKLVRVLGETPSGPATFVLHVARAAKVPWLEDAKAARTKGNLAEARALLAPRAGEPAAKSLLARLTLQEGRAADAFPLFREAIRLHRAGGHISEAADDTFALAFALHQRSHEYDQAKTALDESEADLGSYPEGRARLPYYRGILASETGDRRNASVQLRGASDAARALGMTKLERNARGALAVEMETLGRPHEALAALRALASELDTNSATDCERVESLNNIGWAAILVNESNDGPREDARSPLEQAIAITACSDEYVRSFALANLARIDLEEKKLEAAREHLAAAKSAVKEPRGTERLAWIDLGARIDLASGKSNEALAAFDEELALARDAALFEPQWSAHVGRAEALRARAARAEATGALLAAEDVVEKSMLLVPLGDGRGGFLAQRSRSASMAVQLLADLGRTDEAARLAKRSRARLLDSVERALRIEQLPVEERRRWDAAVGAYRSAREALDAEAAADWKLPATELAKTIAARKSREDGARAALEKALADLAREERRTPAPTEVLDTDVLELVVHPVAPGRSLAFLRSSTKTTMASLDDPTPGTGGAKAATTKLVELLAPRLDGKERLRIFAYGSWRDLDLHAATVASAPLLERVVVDYPLGLRERPTATTGAGSTASSVSEAAGVSDPNLPAPKPSGPKPRIAVVGDPASDLLFARTEATLVTRSTDARARVDTLIGPVATARSITQAASGASLFHYAGHGVFAGVEGFESAFPLAEGGRFTVADVLAVLPAPHKVSLTSCSAAKNAGAAEGLGLAQAFVVAGADEVLAPTRPVSDELALSVARLLYTGPSGDAVVRGERGALAAAARSTLRHIAKEHPETDWAAFRVIAR